MKKLCALSLAALLLALSVNPTRAEDEQESRLAFELDSLREAWLYADGATAAARLDTLREDNRLSGEFPRWYAGLRASLALREGDSTGALKVMQPILDESNDARNYLRAARLFLAYGADDTALEIIRQGRRRGPDSRALLRYEAGLHWLAGDYDNALDCYTDIICSDDRPQYPFVAPNTTRWSEAKPWNATSDKPATPPRQMYDEWGDPIQTPDTYQPEPFSSLFMPIWWWPCDLPGLDRCIDELARAKEQNKFRTMDVAALVKLAHEAQDKLDTLRTGDETVRKQLEDKARRTRWQAVIATRIAAQAKLNASEWEAAEALVRNMLTLAPDDLALLDLQAQAMGELGKAEEARTGPLARLRTLANLSVYSYGLYARGPSRQISDRVFEPALTLYRANKQAGQTQLELMRTTFGDTNRNQPIYAGLLGLWLMTHNEPELARKYLLEASRLNGFESGKPLYQDAIYVEMALLALGEGTGEQPKETPEEGPKEGEKEVEKPQPAEGEEEGIEMAKVDANTHPLLRKALRAGAVIGAIPDTREKLRELAGVDIWGGSAGIGSVIAAASMLPDGNKVMQQSLYGLPAQIAKDVPAKELNAFLSDEHVTSQSLKQALTTMAELIEQVRANNSWQVRQSLSQKTGPVFGLLEARALLLRAKLIADKPANMDELAAWLSKWQKQIDLRTQLKARPSDAHTRFSEARREAGVPEVVHSGLLLDAARLLATGGAAKDAARLLWYNRDAQLGLETQNRLMSLASVLAEKAGDHMLALRCRLEATSLAPNQNSNSYLDPQLLLVELAGTRDDLAEFGSAGDVLTYLENQLIPFADSPTMAAIEQIVPDIRKARPTLVMRNTSRTGTDGIFANSMSSGNCYVIVRNWYKMAISPETLPICERFAAWVIASDLPVSGRGTHNGLAPTGDAITGWSMLRDIYKKQSANDPKALKATERLTRLLTRTNTLMDEVEDEYEEWWD
ncbi:MAG: hypothetical protein H6839_15210 [Planctomycetes bacterium]|nr:hypothetical protein [Planctomycetota bacterium]